MGLDITFKSKDKQISYMRNAYHVLSCMAANEQANETQTLPKLETHYASIYDGSGSYRLYKDDVEKIYTLVLRWRGLPGTDQLSHNGRKDDEYIKELEYMVKLMGARIAPKYIDVNWRFS